MIRTKSNTVNLFLGVVVLLGLSRLPSHAQQAAAPPSADNQLQLIVSHAALSVADIDKEEAFFVQVLGFTEIQRGGSGPDFQWRHLSIPGVYRIDLTYRKGSARHIDPAAGNDMEQGWDHVGFDAPDLDKTYQQLVAKNANVKVSRDKNNAVNNLMVIDPEGNKIQIQH